MKQVKYFGIILILMLSLFSVGAINDELIKVGLPSTTIIGPNTNTWLLATDFLYNRSNNYNIDTVTWSGRRVGSITKTVTVRIETVDGSNFPTGTLAHPNAQVTFNSSILGTTTAVYNITFSNPFSLVNGTKYAFVTDMPWIDASNVVQPGVEVANTYPDGSRLYSTNNGGSWTRTTSQETSFALYGYISLTPTITTNLSNYYNIENISIQLNTTTNTNMSYSLDGAGLTSICNDCNSSTLNLTSLSETLHNISFKSVDTNGYKWTNETFIIDLSAPVINLTFPAEINLNNVSMNLSDYINITDALNFTCTAEVTEYGQSTQNLGNCLNATYTFTISGNATIRINATDLAGNKASNSTIVNVNLFRVNMTFFSQFSGDPLDQVSVYESTLGLVGSTGGNTSLIVLLNPGNYTFTAVKTSFVNTTLNFTKSNITVVENLSFNMSSIFTFTLLDERTLELWNISATDLVTLQVVCEDQSVIQSIVNSTNFSIDVPCSISKFKFLIDYTSDSYFRSILIDETERNRNVYLIDLTTTQSVFNTFTLFDLTSIYDNPRLSFKKFVGSTAVEITGDVIDAEGKVPAYLILNDEYILELSSDNLPTRSLGFYSADVPGDKVLKLFTLDFSQSATTKNGKVFMWSYIDNTTLFGTFNDTTGTTSLVTFTIYNTTKYGNIIFQDTIASTSVGGFSYNIPHALENMTLYTTLVLVNSLDTYTDVRTHRQNNQIGLGLINLTNIDLDWVITVFLGFIALTLTVSTASVGALILMAIAALFVSFGWFQLSWFTIVLGLLLAIVKIVKEEEKK